MLLPSMRSGTLALELVFVICFFFKVAEFGATDILLASYSRECGPIATVLVQAGEPSMSRLEEPAIIQVRNVDQRIAFSDRAVRQQQQVADFAIYYWCC